MFWDLVLFCLLGGIISADVDAAWQSMLSQPLVACSLAGALLGNVGLGLTFGILLQLPFLVELPVGGATVSLAGVSCYVGGGLAIILSPVFPEMPSIVLFSCVFFSLAVSVALILPLRWLRAMNLILMQKADIAADAGDLERISRLQSVGIVSSIAFGVLSTAVLFLIGKLLLPEIVAVVPAGLERAFDFVMPVLLGAGLGAAAYLFVRTKTVRLALAGLAVGAGLIWLAGG